MPFFFTFMLLKNDASVTWQLNTLLAFILLMIVVNWFMFTVLCIVGVTTAVSLYFLTTPAPVFNDNFTVTVINIIAMLICCIFILRKKDKIQNEKFEALNSFGSTVAHELRTPLSAIRNGVEGIKVYLPDLVDAYKKAREANLSVEHIRKDQLASLEKCVGNIEAESNLANLTINILLANVRQSKLAQSEVKRFLASALVGEALERYPMPSEQRVLIHVNNEHDFMIQGDEELLTHVVFNLLKNALYYIEAAQKGEITIWFNSDDKDFHHIHFKDTSQGITPEDLPRIFDRFYTRRYHGTGIGLAFCRTVMRVHKGNIICQSVLGEYAEFIISFPKIEQEIA